MIISQSWNTLRLKILNRAALIFFFQTIMAVMEGMVTTTMDMVEIVIEENTNCEQSL